MSETNAEKHFTFKSLKWLRFMYFFHVLHPFIGFNRSHVLIPFILQFLFLQKLFEMDAKINILHVLLHG